MKAKLVGYSSVETFPDKETGVVRSIQRLCFVRSPNLAENYEGLVCCRVNVLDPAISKLPKLVVNKDYDVDLITSFGKDKLLDMKEAN